MPMIADFQGRLDIWYGKSDCRHPQALSITLHHTLRRSENSLQFTFLMVASWIDKRPINQLMPKPFAVQGYDEMKGYVYSGITHHAPFLANSKDGQTQSHAESFAEYTLDGDSVIDAARSSDGGV